MDVQVVNSDDAVNDEIKKANILIVDDEEFNIEVIKQTLEGAGYTSIRHTTDSREVAGIYKEFKPDLVLLDIRMPHLDGFQVMDQLKDIEKDSYLAILVLTAHADDETCVRALNNGAKDFLAKPFQLVEMMSRVKNMIEVRMLHNQVRNQNKILEVRVNERTKELHDTRLSIIRRLGRAAEYRDNETGNHVIRMSRYSAILAREYGMTEQQCDLLLHASPMHDVGKIGIPDSILLKPGKLDVKEFEKMKSHVVIGAEILSGDESDLIRLAWEIALQHHERWDGKGYPNGLKGEEITVAARIVSISDVFDALTSVRPYKKAWPVEETLKEIRDKSGVMFDPKIVELLDKALPEILKIKEQFSD